MKYTIATALAALGIALVPALGAEKKAPAKPAVPAVPTAPGAVSESDKALLAHAKKGSAKLKPTDHAKLLTLANTGSVADLQAIPGIGETKAAAIQKARPFKIVDELIMVDGIGEVTYDEIIEWTNAGMPKDARANPAAKSADKAKKTVEDAAGKPDKAKKAAEKATEKADKAADKADDKATDKAKDKAANKARKAINKVVP